MENIAYGVPGIDKEAGELIEKRLEKLPGVGDVTVWLNQAQIDVSYDPARVSPEAIVDALRRLGFLAQQVPWVQRGAG